VATPSAYPARRHCHGTRQRAERRSEEAEPEEFCNATPKKPAFENFLTRLGAGFRMYEQADKHPFNQSKSCENLHAIQLPLLRPTHGI
jgi:hypothetical protein